MLDFGLGSPQEGSLGRRRELFVAQPETAWARAQGVAGAIESSVLREPLHKGLGAAPNFQVSDEAFFELLRGKLFVGLFIFRPERGVQGVAFQEDERGRGVNEVGV